MKKNLLFSMLLLLLGMGSVNAQETFTKWKQVQGSATLDTNDEVVVVDLTTSSAMKNILLTRRETPSARSRHRL